VPMLQHSIYDCHLVIIIDSQETSIT